MTDPKKKILISKKLLETSVGVFFQDSGFECIDVFKEDEKSEYCFIVNDYCPENKYLPRVTLDSKMFFDNDETENIKGFFDQKFLPEKDVNDLLKIFFHNNGDVDLIDYYSQGVKKVVSIKIQDRLNIGFFIDSIVIDAYEHNFDFNLIRKYLNQIIEYSFEFIEETSEVSTLELSYTNSQDAFALEVSFSRICLNLTTQDLSKLGSKTNFFNAYRFSKRNKTIFSSLWFKKANLKDFNAMFFGEFFKKYTISNHTSPIVLGIEKKNQISYQDNGQKQKSLLANKLIEARRFVTFIINTRLNDSNRKDLRKLEIADIDEYLIFYPVPTKILNIDYEVKKYVLKLLQNEKLFNGINEYLSNTSQENLHPQAENIQNLLSSKTLTELNEIVCVRTGNSSLENGSGFFNWKAGVEHGESSLVCTVTDDDKWKVLRSQLINKIKEEIVKCSLTGSRFLKEDIIKIFSTELNVEAEKNSIIVNEIIEEALSLRLTQGSSLEDSFPLNLLALQSVSTLNIDKSKTEVHLIRAMKVIEQMKNTIIKLEVKLKQSGIGENNKSEEGEKNIVLQIENKKLIEELDNITTRMNLVVSNIEKNSNDLILEKDNQIDLLEANVVKDRIQIQKITKEYHRLENRLSEESQKLASLHIANDKILNLKNDFINNQESFDLQLLRISNEKIKLEEKLKEQKIESKMFEQKLKFKTAQLLEESKKSKSSTAGSRNTDDNSRLLEVASARIETLTHELIDKKKELIKFKLDNTLLTTKLADLEKKLTYMMKKAG